MKKSQHIMELLSYPADSDILRQLHGTHGFDFEKPFGVIRIEGKFTVNGVLKLLAENGYDADASDCVVFLHGASQYRSGHTHFFKSVKLAHTWRNGGFAWEFDIDVNPKRSPNSYRLCTFYSKTEFEFSRKNSDIAFAVVQATEHLTCLPKERELDKLSRVKLREVEHSKWDNRKIISLLRVTDETGAEFTYRIPYWMDDNAELKDIIDGSGYLVAEHRAALTKRLNDFIAKRENEAASAIDYSENIETLELLLAAKKIMLIEKLKAAKTSEELYDFERKVSDHRYLVERVNDFKKRANEKTFKSVEQSATAYSNLVARLSA